MKFFIPAWFEFNVSAFFELQTAFSLDPRNLSFVVVRALPKMLLPALVFSFRVFVVSFFLIRLSFP